MLVKSDAFKIGMCYWMMMINNMQMGIYVWVVCILQQTQYIWIRENVEMEKNAQVFE